MRYIIAYDLGTGGTKASLFEESGISVAHSFVGCETYYPQENYREQRPREWWDTVKRSSRELLKKTGINPDDIECLAVSGHSLGVVPMGYDGSLLCEQVPIWSDSRAGDEAADFFTRVSEEAWYMTTGNGFPAALYAVFKMMWYQNHMPDMFARVNQFIGTKDYINYRMTGVLCTDYSYASGSGVYDLTGWKYQEEYINLSGIPRHMFPEIVPSTKIIGTLTKEAAEELGLSESVKVACGAVDNSCMAAGAACVGEGEAYTSLGTSSWIAVSSCKPVLDAARRPYVFTHCVPGMFVSATAIFSAGNSFQWLRDQICRNFVEAEAQGGKDAYTAMTDLAETSPAGANRLIFNPSLAGGSSLDKSLNIRGAFVGLDLAHTQADLIRAALEGICMNLKIALDALEECTELNNEMLLVGGGGKSQFWRSLFASIYNKNIIEMNVGQDAGSLGAALIAGVGAGIWKDFDAVKGMVQVKSVQKPDQEACMKYERLFPLFKQIAEIQSTIGDMMAEYV